jgi:CRP/FNR family cyclic AMP-dependent transcriptional regulator
MKPAKSNISYQQKIDSLQEEKNLMAWAAPFFEGIGKAELNSLFSNFHYKQFQQKQYILPPHRQGKEIFFLLRGNVDMGYLDESGRELSIDVLGPGQIFGTFTENHLPSAYARTISKTVVGIQSKADFHNFLSHHPQYALYILKMLEERMTMLEQKLQAFVFKDVRTRICTLLESLFRKAGDQKTGRIRIPLTHQDIANLVGSSRETASLCLSELKKQGIIETGRRKIRILSRKDLIFACNL